NSNTEKQQVLAGVEIDFQKAIQLLKDSSIRKVIKLKVSGAFHTSRFERTASEFCKSINDIKLDDLNNDVYSNVTAKVLEKDIDMKQYFKNHMVTGVDFYNEIVNMLADGYDTFIEIGEVSVLSSMIKNVNRDVNVIHINSLEAIEKLEV
ncbi:MAG: ACP S-malonyltransferase, partial [Mycoplasmatales bacterium]